MAEPKLRAFRWLGTRRAEGAVGVLQIRRDDGRVVVVPPHIPGQIERECIVRDPTNLAALGAARIEELVKSGQAEYINLVDGALEMFRKDDPGALKEFSEMQQIVQDSADESASLFKMAQAQRLAGHPLANVAGERLPGTPATT
jgi:hypothetical protein